MAYTQPFSEITDEIQQFKDRYRTMSMTEALLDYEMIVELYQTYSNYLSKEPSDEWRREPADRQLARKINARLAFLSVFESKSKSER